MLMHSLQNSTFSIQYRKKTQKTKPKYITQAQAANNTEKRQIRHWSIQLRKGLVITNKKKKKKSSGSEAILAEKSSAGKHNINIKAFLIVMERGNAQCQFE